MNKEKVFIEGYEVGFLVDTTGAREKKIQVANGEIVSIDERFIYKSIEREKVQIPQFVADWIEESKQYCENVVEFFEYRNPSFEITKWIEEGKRFDLIARAWLYGYEVEKEKRYLVKVKGVCGNHETLNCGKNSKKWLFSDREENSLYKTKHTRKELEEAGFGWVFDCQGIKIEEVE